jgi:hypothetical protein
MLNPAIPTENLICLGDKERKWNSRSKVTGQRWKVEAPRFYHATHLGPLIPEKNQSEISMRNGAPLPQVQSEGCLYQAMRLPIILLIATLFWGSKCTSYIVQLTASLGWRRSQQWLSGHQAHGKTKGVGCGCFRFDELGANAKVPLVMNRSIWVILEVALLTVWSDWPPCFTVASDARCYRFRRR